MEGRGHRPRWNRHRCLSLSTKDRSGVDIIRGAIHI
jgi:hypothetical protein